MANWGQLPSDIFRAINASARFNPSQKAFQNVLRKLIYHN